MTDDDNALEGAEFESALAKLQAGSPELKAAASLIATLRDAVTELQEQVYSGEDDEEDDDK